MTYPEEASPDIGATDEDFTNWEENNAHADGQEPTEASEEDHAWEQELRARLASLTGHADSIELAVRRALVDLNTLTGNDLYDIELAEGEDGSDARDDLEAIARLGRNLRRIIAARILLLDSPPSGEQVTQP